MDSDLTQTAFNILNEYSVDKLTEIFRTYGEVPNAYKLSNKIIQKRLISPIETSGELMKIIDECIPYGTEKRKYTSQVFQAVRIVINDEINSLKSFLSQSVELIKKGGRLVIITYHSLEDRVVKNFFQSGNFKGEKVSDIYGNFISPFKIISKKVIIPEDQEISDNPRSRSAKLRIAEKI
jgi:16S rRNA (cytosine1402-N4)-methyltransferase